VMAAIFAGASRALLASAVFAFETTRQPLGLLPLLGGCTASYLVSSLLMRNSIMTEKIARRGVRVLADYSVDFLEQVLVRDRGLRAVTTVAAGSTIAALRAWLAAGAGGSDHQGYPVLDEQGLLVGLVTRRELERAPDPSALVTTLLRRPAVVVFDDSSLREAADQMVREQVGRLPVVTRAAPRRVVGILTRSDLLAAHTPRLEESERREQPLRLTKT
jgi:chloride channel protein, CIC family